MRKPLMIDLFAGLGGWAEGGLAEGYDVVGFDIERHRYPARALPEGGGVKVAASGVDFNNHRVGSSKNRSFNYANEVALRDAPLIGGWIEYPAQLVVQDVLTLHGSQFRDAALIVASPPCQAYSYRAMPWKRAKALPPPDNTLFLACFRIQREACEAAGRHIPMVVENVRGAQKWVGRARWNYGSFYLWGDVPALMPAAGMRKVSASHLHLGGGNSFVRAQGDATQKREAVRYDPRHAERRAVEAAEGRKVSAIDFNTKRETGQTSPGFNVTAAQRYRAGIKNGNDWFGSGADCSEQRRHGSKSDSRKAASAMIAKIPLPLSRTSRRPSGLRETAKADMIFPATLANRGGFGDATRRKPAAY